VIGETVISPTWTSRARRSTRTSTVWEEISAADYDTSSRQAGGELARVRGWFNFRGADQQKKVGVLSGGERNRLHLAKLLKSGGNVLLLDEPTNDLDVDTLRALEDALLAFAGCAVVISHDRWFLDRIATHILAFEGDSGSGVVRGELRGLRGRPPPPAVYVSRGLLALVNAEDELAGVLGHETGHVVARHAAARMSAGAPLRVVTGIGALATGVVAPRLGRMVGGLGDVAGDLVLQQYGRQQEREADEIGQRLAAQAGWDPGGLPAFLRTLAREEQLTTGRVRRTAFLSSHPATPERIGDTEARARGLARGPGAPIAAGRDAVLARLEGLVVGPDPAAGFVADGRFVHPDLDLVVEFPEGWEIGNVAAFAEGTAPDGAIRVAIQLAEGDDPMTAARTFAAASDVVYAEGRPRARSTAGPRCRRSPWSAREPTRWPCGSRGSRAVTVSFCCRA
jgi:hypothetical protein